MCGKSVTIAISLLVLGWGACCLVLNRVLDTNDHPWMAHFFPKLDETADILFGRDQASNGTAEGTANGTLARTKREARVDSFNNLDNFRVNEGNRKAVHFTWMGQTSGQIMYYPLTVEINWRDFQQIAIDSIANIQKLWHKGGYKKISREDCLNPEHQFDPYQTFHYKDEGEMR